MNNIKNMVENTMVRVKTEKMLQDEKIKHDIVSFRKWLMLTLDTNEQREVAKDIIKNKLGLIV